LTGAPISGIGATLDQTGGFEVVEEVGHDRSVDSEVLRESELAADGAVGSSGERLIAAGTAGQIRHRGVRGGDVGPEDRPESPTQIVRQRIATAAYRLCRVLVLSDIGHDFIVTGPRKKVLMQDVL
jgi:hypothetical protein